MTKVREFYKNKSIFVTGGSGFMGKVLIEKLLYSCSGVKEIFLLMRQKQGKCAEERFLDLLNLPVFSRIKDQPNLLSKITPLYGDVTKPNLGLSEEHLKLAISSTNIFFNLAASIKMNSSLKSSIEANLKATKNVLELCKKMKNLLVILHVSTAFCNCDLDVVEERVYDWPLDPKDLIKYAEILPENEIEKLGKSIMKSFPNPYIFTKRMTEILLRDEFFKSELNICIVRPSIVTPSWREPMEGFVDTLNGLVGLIIAAGKGILRTMMCKGWIHAQVIPVDQAVSGIIAIAHDVGSRERKSEISVFNATCSESKLTKISEILEKSKKIIKSYPLEPGLWFPDGDVTMNPIKHYFLLIFTMWLPALLIDFLLLTTFQSPCMIQAQKKIFNGMTALQFFGLREWKFKYEKFEKVFWKLSEEERKIFNMNTEEVDGEEYLKNCILSGRKYCLKESEKTIPRSRVFLRIQFVIDQLFKGFLIKLIGSWILNFANFNESQASFVLFVTITFFVVNNIYENFFE